MQIMALLTHKQARLDIPAYGDLPGTPLPEIEEYVQLIQVCHVYVCDRA